MPRARSKRQPDEPRAPGNLVLKQDRSLTRQLVKSRSIGLIYAIIASESGNARSRNECHRAAKMQS